MRRVLIALVLLAVPSLAFAQAVPPANKEAVLLQLLEDMKQSRAVIHPSEVEAAGCKVQLRQMQSELETLKQAAEKAATPADTEPKE